MLYHFLYPLHTTFSALNVFRYITFRTIYASLTAFLICFFLGPWLIRKMTELQIGQYIQEDGPARHHKKAGTPTMGGLLIVIAITVSTLLWANLTNFYIWLVLSVLIGFAGIGFVDDYLKLIKKHNKGLSARGKFALQVVLAAAAGVLVCWYPGFSTEVTVPFFKHISPDLGWGYVLFATLVIVGTSNAVNLTDGLDGLAIGPLIIAAVDLHALCLRHRPRQNRRISAASIRAPAAGKSPSFSGPWPAPASGFLWFNAYPAQIFMGDVGSLSLGGALGTMAVITKQEILLTLVGGLFVIEALSVIFQVGFFKMTKGKRIFRMAPLHHHFELKGWPEPKVIVRFWIIAIALALISMSTLKLR